MAIRSPAELSRYAFKEICYEILQKARINAMQLPGGGVKDGEDVLTALRREVYEETGCICDEIKELGIVAENRASLDKAQKIFAEAIDGVKSVGLMKKLGMQLEGIQRSQVKNNRGNWTDLYFYGLLEDDWRKRNDSIR